MSVTKSATHHFCGHLFQDKQRLWWYIVSSTHHGWVLRARRMSGRGCCVSAPAPRPGQASTRCRSASSVPRPATRGGWPASLGRPPVWTATRTNTRIRFWDCHNSVLTSPLSSPSLEMAWSAIVAAIPKSYNTDINKRTTSQNNTEIKQKVQQMTPSHWSWEVKRKLKLNTKFSSTSHYIFNCALGKFLKEWRWYALQIVNRSAVIEEFVPDDSPCSCHWTPSWVSRTVSARVCCRCPRCRPPGWRWWSRWCLQWSRGGRGRQGRGWLPRSGCWSQAAGAPWSAPRSPPAASSWRAARRTSNPRGWRPGCSSWSPWPSWRGPSAGSRAPHHGPEAQRI